MATRAGRKTRASKRVEPRHFPTVRGRHIALGPGSPMQQPLPAKAPQVVGGLLGSVVPRGQPQKVDHGSTQILITKARDQVSEEAEGQHQGHHSRIAKAKSRRFLTVLVDGRLHHSLDAVGGEPTVLTHLLDFQKSPVDLAPDLLQIAEVRQTFVDVEVFRIAEGSLSAQGTTLLEVLLEVKALV